MAKSKKPDWKEERPVYLWLAILGAALAIIFYFIPKDTRDIAETKLATVSNLVLSQPPEIRITKGKEGVLLHVQGYDKPFQVAGFDFSETAKRNIIQDIRVGDTITVKVDSSEFSSLGQETFFDSYTEIHSLTKERQEYLSIQKANLKAKNDLELGVPVGLFLFVAGLIYWKLPTRPMFSPSIVIGIGALLIVLVSKQ
ncbi:MAG TPA: hypothetical protein VGN63_14430 [Flavisolibacter sp.]|nr:hypothetical protein [Flavisolibacter sp.]